MRGIAIAGLNQSLVLSGLANISPIIASAIKTGQKKEYDHSRNMIMKNSAINPCMPMGRPREENRSLLSTNTPIDPIKLKEDITQEILRKKCNDIIEMKFKEIDDTREFLIKSALMEYFNGKVVEPSAMDVSCMVDKHKWEYFYVDGNQILIFDPKTLYSWIPYNHEWDLG